MYTVFCRIVGLMIERPGCCEFEPWMAIKRLKFKILSRLELGISKTECRPGT